MTHDSDCKDVYNEVKYSLLIERDEDGSVIKDQFLSCILSGPPTSSLQQDTDNDDEVKLTGRKGVIILLHGSEGHKDYCYHKILSLDLWSKLQLRTLRFDFRNSGDSSNSHGPRTIKQDVFDLRCVIQDLERRNLEIKGIVAHSRGALAMFQYCITYKVVDPNWRLVNVAGRFRGHGLYDRLISRHPNLLTDGGFFTTQLRFGERRANNEWISFEESSSLISYQMDKVIPQNLSSELPVLNVYGTKDTVIPFKDSESYYSILKSNGNPTKLVYVEGANHNFHGVEPYDDSVHTGLTKHRRRDVVDYSYELSDIITNYLTPEQT